MTSSGLRTILLWFSATACLIALVSGFTIAVDPFGYFGTNRIGYYFSSERQFKFNLVKSFDYNAILIGDSRIAFTDAASIDLPAYRFVNAGVGGASLAEEIELFKASRLDRLKLAVIGSLFTDLNHGSCSRGAKAGSQSFWDPLRFAFSWNQFGYAVEAVLSRAGGERPNYSAEGTRSAASRYFEEATLTDKTEQYWKKIDANTSTDKLALTSLQLDGNCRAMLAEAQRVADRHGITLILLLLPQNQDFLDRLNWVPAHGEEQLAHLVAQIEQVVPHVVDLSSSSFSDSRNFWLFDSTHFKPDVGAHIIEAAIKGGTGAEVKR